MRTILALSFFIMAGCLKFSSDSWQGIHFPKVCDSCEAKEVHSPSFKSYNECKSWVFSKMGSDEKGLCGRNCSFEGSLGLSKCEIVVRSWPGPLGNSPQFSDYQE